ncbi:ankyrin, partial [Pluteus cervinus]
MELLIKHGADVSCTTSNGKTPLHFAAEQWGVSAVELLVKHGADVSCTTSNGKTLLHLAA